MKIIFDDRQNCYFILIEYPETETWINTSDIVKAREEFVERMTWMFNETVCEKLKAEC